MQISEIDRRVLGIEKKTLDEIRKEMIAHKQDEEKQAIQELKELETEELDIRNGEFFPSWLLLGQLFLMTCSINSFEAIEVYNG